MGPMQTAEMPPTDSHFDEELLQRYESLDSYPRLDADRLDAVEFGVWTTATEWGRPPKRELGRVDFPDGEHSYYRVYEMNCGYRWTTPPPVRRSQNATRGKGFAKAEYRAVQRH